MNLIGVGLRYWKAAIERGTRGGVDLGPKTKLQPQGLVLVNEMRGGSFFDEGDVGGEGSAGFKVVVMLDRAAREGGGLGGRK